MSEQIGPVEIRIPEVSLVLLIGASGSGKSTFGREKFGPFEVVSSDFCRGLISGDENDQSVSGDAFDLLEYIVGKRLAAGRLTVVDATNVQPGSRASLIKLARAHDVLPVAIVLDMPEAVCRERNRNRPDRQNSDAVITRQRDALRRSRKSLGREGLRGVHVLSSPEEADAAVIVRERLRTDLRDQHGPFDAIGDVHGCLSELETMLTTLGYDIARDAEGRPVDAVHPEGRRVILLGDLVDRGPDSVGVLRLAMGMHAAGHALVVPGNHEQALISALGGKKVNLAHGLGDTLAQLAAEPTEFTEAVRAWLYSLVSHLVLDDGNLVVAHAGLKEAYHGRSSGRVRSFALYGDTTGEVDDYGLPIRLPWQRDYRGSAVVLYGHTPLSETRWVNNTLCLDTGCSFGNKLSALRYPERELVQVPAERQYAEPRRPLGDPEDVPVPAGQGVAAAVVPRATPATTPTAAPALPEPAVPVAAGDRAADELRLEDVLGRRSIETALHGRVAIRPENAAGALEVMSRFALSPNLLPTLPATMAPVETSREPGYLEYPTEAFAGYLAAGVTDLIAEEKHMGSRAHVLVCRDAAAAATLLGTPAGVTGAIFTRTGRTFFDAETTETLLDRIRSAAETAGLWERLDTDWLLLDGELLPWSLKAEDLLRGTYAATAAAARASLGAAGADLALALARGVEAAGEAERTTSRLGHIEDFSRAYRRYVWPVDGLDGVEFAPFQLLASRDAVHHERDHGWHLEIADALVAADPVTFRTTRRLRVDAADPASVSAATDWWLELTAAGGEGMVVKPYAGTTFEKNGLVQPGLKVRGREYLRLIYGPDYTDPGQLSRLRDRHLGLKRSLALREHALGIEALTRFVQREPLWRVHEAVFGILALESEPVDPRL
ncbi:polynucleotide kinase-phosphatase [Mycetocola tolaasinivorans]|uniref:Polynucleotide kinase-phosphatase n=1 Tax=Mycetocola tolaasinivorans TaxID=76635 RepID=A0A3L7A8B6_9MICO|nr:polynucleotide kinase-phosphatase [Mycetocola tolaasinivorans]RLP76070.1 polynucleotide kinase-phosphatase [Mycetocola tolaasinivorans]